jgi:hypothetical protein
MPGPDCRGELVANQGKRPIRLNARPRLRLRKWCRDGAPRSHLRERVHGQRLVPLIIRWSSAAWWSIPPGGGGGPTGASEVRRTRPNHNGGRAVLPHWGTGARASCSPHRSCIVLRRVGGTPRPQRGETATTTRHSLHLTTAAPRRRPEGIRFWARRSWIHSSGSVSIVP